MKNLETYFITGFWSKRLIIIILCGLCLFGCEQTPSEQIISDLVDVLKSVEEYEYGESRNWLQDYHDVFARIYNDSTTHPEAERLMIKLLKSKASYQSKLLICKSLASIGTEASLPVLSEMLAEPETANMAVIALTHITSEKADQVLIDELSKSKDLQLVGVLNALALRKTGEAVDAISPYLQDDQPMVSHAAANALGEIGGNKAIQILTDKFKTNQLADIAKALIHALSESPGLDHIELYEILYQSDLSLSIKTAAFLGLVDSQPDNEKVEYLLATLQTSDASFQESLIPSIRKLDQNLSLTKMIEAMPGFNPPFQYQLMLAIADRGEEEVRPYAIKLLNSSDWDARIAALKALKSVSNSMDLQLLAKIASNQTGQEQDLARSCIYWMNDQNTDQRIVELSRTARGQQKAEYIMAIGYRKIEEATGYVISQVSSNDNSVRKAAIESAGKIAGKDYLDEVMKNAFSSNIKETEKQLIVDALTRIAMNSNNPDECARTIDERLEVTSKESPTVIMILTLGNIGNDHAREIIKTYLDSDNENIQFACLQSFANWSNDGPLSDIESVFPNIISSKNRQQATVAFVNLVQQSGSLNGDDKAAKIIGIYSDAQSSYEKVILINGLSRLGSFKAMDFILAHLDDEQINANIQEAFIRIADNLRYGNEKKVLEKIDSLIASTAHEDFKNKLTILKRSIEL